jgi:hypothetical protein
VNPTLRSPRRILIDTAGKWRELVVRTRWGHGKAITELAERWTTSDVPEVDALLASRDKTQQFVAGEGQVGDAEIDLLIEGQAAGGRVLIGVVPVGIEPLGRTIEEEQQRSLNEDRLRGGPPPTEAMARRVFNIESSIVGGLRWRLLGPNAVLLREAEARGCAVAVFIIHEFRSPLTPPQVYADQLADIQSYLLKLAHRGADTDSGRLLGPFMNATKVPLYVGRAVHQR